MSRIEVLAPRKIHDYETAYGDMLQLIERLHRLLLDVVKDEFERLGLIEINAVQGLLLHNIGENEVTAGELKSRGYYQGSNVSYNLKKLVQLGYMHHEKCQIDRRAVRVRLTEKGRMVREAVAKLLSEQAERAKSTGVMDDAALIGVTDALRRTERFWGDQIRYIY